MVQWCKRHGAECGIWILEFQKRGAPHFHLFTEGYLHFLEVREAWYRIVGSGDPKHLEAGTRVEELVKKHAAGAYAAKYASKHAQKEVPEDFRNVGRFWGSWGKPCEKREISLHSEVGFQAVRTVRRVYQAERRQLPKGAAKKRFRDNGISGFIAWGTGPATQSLLRRLTTAERPIDTQKRAQCEETLKPYCCTNREIGPGDAERGVSRYPRRSQRTQNESVRPRSSGPSRPG